MEYFTTSSYPFIIAEMSGNHNQSIERALQIVDAAADAGAHAIKLQTYTADTMTLKDAVIIEDVNSIWNGRELHDLYNEAHTPWDWHEKIFIHAKKRGMMAFSTPFDETAVDFLESLNVPAYKIASFENTDIPLLKKVAATKKPVILSTGAASIADLDLAVTTLRGNGCGDLSLLKCTSTYPASPLDSNLLTIPHMSSLFNCPVGLSDHTMGIGVAVAAIALGATIIEKHFTLNRKDGGVDSVFSMEPQELKQLVVETKRAFDSLGSIQYGIRNSESQSVNFKRSIYISKDLQAGEILTSDNLKIIRPSLGLATRYYDIVIGKPIKQEVKAGTPLTWKLI